MILRVESRFCFPYAEQDSWAMSETDGREVRECAAGDLSAKLPVRLNSKRLSAPHLKWLAKTLDAPTAAAGDELRQMIEGWLMAQGREPRNVQVVFGATLSSVFSLQDLEGTFHMVEEDVTGKRASRESESELQSGSDPKKLADEPDGLGEELRSLRSELDAVKAENLELRQQLNQEKVRLREVWRTNCQCLAGYAKLLAQQEAEISRLKGWISRLKGLQSARSTHFATPVSGEEVSSGLEERPHAVTHKPRWCKAPPVDPFTGDNPEMRLEDWLPSLQQASSWNQWTEEELLLQLAGHLRGCALQEWGLLDESSKKTYSAAVECLCVRLDPGSHTLAA